MNSSCVPVHLGLQHFVLFPASPYGLPLDFTILPQKLKESGMYIRKQELTDDTYVIMNDNITAMSGMNQGLNGYQLPSIECASFQRTLEA